MHSVARVKMTIRLPHEIGWRRRRVMTSAALLVTQPLLHTFNGPLSRTTRVSRYQKGKTNLDFTGARDSEWQWHQLGNMQVSTWLQTDNHASTPPLSFFTGRMPFLPRNQQRQSTEGIVTQPLLQAQLLSAFCRRQKSHTEFY